MVARKKLYGVEGLGIITVLQITYLLTNKSAGDISGCAQTRFSRFERQVAHRLRRKILIFNGALSPEERLVVTVSRMRTELSMFLKDS